MKLYFRFILCSVPSVLFCSVIFCNFMFSFFCSVLFCLIFSFLFSPVLSAMFCSVVSSVKLIFVLYHEVHASVAYSAHTLQDEKYDHIAAAEIKKVEKAVEEKQKWLDSKWNAQAQLPLHKDPVVLVKIILGEKQVSKHLDV